MKRTNPENGRGQLSPTPQPDAATLAAVRQLIDSESDLKVRLVRACYQHGRETELCRRYKSDLNTLVLLREKVTAQTVQEFMDMPKKYPPIRDRWFFDGPRTDFPHRD